MKLFIAFVGAHSRRAAIGVFSTEEKAKEAIAKDSEHRPAYRMDIEEVTLDVPKVEE